MDATATAIVSQASETWEYELAGYLFQTGLEPVREFYANGLASGLTVPAVLDRRQAADYVRARVNLLAEWAAEVSRVVTKDAPRAFGPPGIAGDPSQIEAVCKQIILFCQRLVEWERDAQKTGGPVHWNKVFSLLRGSTRPLADTVFRLVDVMASVPERLRQGETRFDLRMIFPAPPQLVALEKELPRAWKAGASFWEKHPILAGLALWKVLSR